ncbi:MAG: response regulator [Anaerolineales bacterium]
MKLHELLLIEPDTSSAAFMRHMLTRAGYHVTYAPTGKEGLIAAWRDQPDAMIIELDLPDMDGLELIRRLRDDPRSKHKKILSLTKLSSADIADHALEVGVDHHIMKQADAVDILLRTLAELRGDLTGADGTRPLRPGRVIAFLSAKGGVGTSSLCLNLAQHINQETEGRMAVVDLVLPVGFLAQITGERSPIDIVHLTTELKPQQLTVDYLRGNLKSPKSWSFHLVPGAKGPEQAAKLHADRLAPVLQTLRAGYEHVFVDLGRTLSPLALLVLRQMDLGIMVFSPEPGTVATTSSVLRYLDDHGIPPERLFVVSNRVNGTEDLPVDEVETMLSRPVDGSVPHLGPNMALANRLHAPLELRFPQDSGAQSLADIATAIQQRHKEMERATT